MQRKRVHGAAQLKKTTANPLAALLSENKFRFTEISKSCRRLNSPGPEALPLHKTVPPRLCNGQSELSSTDCYFGGSHNIDPTTVTRPVVLRLFDAQPAWSVPMYTRTLSYTVCLTNLFAVIGYRIKNRHNLFSIW